MLAARFLLLCGLSAVACGGPPLGGRTGVGTGAGGATSASAGHVGAGNAAAAGHDGGASDVATVYLPDDAGRCPMSGGAVRDGGICTCLPGEPSVCDNRDYPRPQYAYDLRLLCADLTTDPDYCGDCATKCPSTSACRAGACTPEPTSLLAVANCTKLDLAVGGGQLFFTDTANGKVYARPFGGPVSNQIGRAHV
jgi:hypothetical protein